MNYLVSYDLIGPNRDYDKIIGKIKTYSSWARVLESVWVIKTDKTATQLRDDLFSAMDGNDKLFVAQLSGSAAWYNLPEDVTSWLKNNL